MRKTHYAILAAALGILIGSAVELVAPAISAQAFQGANVTTATGILKASNGGTGVANNAAATLTRSGNHALTLTTTGTSSLTLPTTGTLTASVACSYTPVDATAAALVFTSVTSRCERVGNLVFTWARFTYPATADTGDATIGGFPVTTPNSAYMGSACHVNTTATNAGMFLLGANLTTGRFFREKFATATSNADLTLAVVTLFCAYPAV